MGGRPVPGSPGEQACAGHLRMGKPHTYVASISSPPPHLGLCPAVKHDWAFQDRDTQFYRFPRLPKFVDFVNQMNVLWSERNVEGKKSMGNSRKG